MFSKGKIKECLPEIGNLIYKMCKNFVKCENLRISIIDKGSKKNYTNFIYVERKVNIWTDYRVEVVAL